MRAHGGDDAGSPPGMPSARLRVLRISAIIIFLVALAAVHESWALQRHSLLPDRSGQQQGSAGSPGAAEPAVQGAAQGEPAGQQPQGSPPGAAATGEPPGTTAPVPGHTAEPSPDAPHAEAPHDAHDDHGPALPEISPVPGVTFVETMIQLMDYELNGRFLGWRPNDIIVGRFTDNVNNYQLGVLEAIRFTTLRLKDSLTRMGDADTYDPDLELAVNLFMNRATLFWFPSAETSYNEAIDHLKAFVGKLKNGKRNFYYRVDNLKLLLASYKDLLGNVNRSLIVSPVSMFKTDDYFYYAKGIAHVYYEILKVVRVGYEKQLASTMNGLEMMDEILHELHRVEETNPWLILDSDLDGFLANHRANLNAPLSEVTHLLGILSTF